MVKPTKPRPSGARHELRQQAVIAAYLPGLEYRGVGISTARWAQSEVPNDGRDCDAVGPRVIAWMCGITAR
jgi:hypothetical protein